MLTLDLKDLKGNVEAAIEFLKSRVDVVKVKGSMVQLQVEHARNAKQVIHKYLHHAGLDGYRVVVVGAGLVKVEAPEMKKAPRKHGRGGGATPAPWETVGSQWYQRNPCLRRPGRRMSNRRRKRMIRGLD